MHEQRSAAREDASPDGREKGLTRADVQRLLRLAMGAEPPRALVVALHQASRGDVEPALGLLRDLGGRVRSASPRGEYVLRREGEYWTLTYEGQPSRVRHVKGLEYVARLLRQPGRSICVTALAGDGAGDPASLERARLSVTKAIKIALARIDTAHPALGRHLAATVRRGYSCVYQPDPRTPIAWTE